MENENIVKFFSEVGYLKRLRHNGLMMAGVETPDTIAAHSYRAAIIGAVLADMEGADPEKVAFIMLFHDLPEARVGDQNKVSARYFDKDEAEKQAFEEQMFNLSESFAEKLRKNKDEYQKRNTKEGVIAKDADWLEMALTAKEYVEIGYSGAQDWINNVEKALETESAKQILSEVQNCDFTNIWWQGLKKMTYKKLEDK